MIANLSQRERIILAGGALFVAITLFYLLVWTPYNAALETLDAKIRSKQKQVVEVQALQRDFQNLNTQIRQAETQLSRGTTFSLFSFIEATEAQVASKENLVYMRPQPSVDQNEFREESVEIKLEKIRLDQLVQLLYEIESANAFLKVKTLRVKTRFDNKSELDAVMTISSMGKK